MSSNQAAELTKLISSRKWSAAETFLEKNSSAAKASDASASKPTFGLYLLHLALRSMAPLPIVAILLDTTRGGHPLSVTTPESATGMFPLHLACWYGAPLSVVDLILMHHPSAIDVKDEFGKTPMDYAKKQTGKSRKEVIAVLNRAEAYQTIATMIHRQAGAEMQELLESKNSKEQLRQELYATQKWAVVMELEALAAKNTASNLERRLAHAKDDLAALQNQSVFSSMFGSKNSTEETSVQRIRELEELIDAKDGDGVRLARRVAELEGMLQKANDAVGNLEESRDNIEVAQTSEKEEDDAEDDDVEPLYASEDMQMFLKRDMDGDEELVSKDLTKAKDKLSTSDAASPKAATSMPSLFSVCL